MHVNAFSHGQEIHVSGFYDSLKLQAPGLLVEELQPLDIEACASQAQHRQTQL